MPRARSRSDPILPFYHIFYLRPGGGFIGGKRFISLPIERIGSEQTETLLGVFTMKRVVGPAQQPEIRGDYYLAKSANNK